MVEFVLDVTDRREAEAALRASEERYHLAVRATNDAVWDWDLRRDRIEWNEALCDAYGHRLNGLTSPGGWWFEHIHPEDRERVFRSIHAVIDGGGDRWADEYRFRRADGGYADVLDRGYMVRGPNSEPVRMIGAMLDVTERRQSERELRRLNEHLEVEVAHRATEFRRQEEALRQSQKLEAVGQLTGGVAHDFNNLLTIIRSSAGLLRRSDLPEERRRRYVEAIVETADRAADFTGQLLAFARRQPLKPEVFVVGERVRVGRRTRPPAGGRAGDNRDFDRVPGLHGGGRPEPVRDSAGQPCGKRARRNGRRGALDAEDLADAQGAAHPRARGHARRLRRGGDIRHGDRDRVGDVGTDLRAVLHDQGAGQRDRPRLESGLLALPSSPVESSRSRARSAGSPLPSISPRRKRSWW